MIALIDGDICLYRVCWASQNEPLDIAKFRLDDMIDHILVETKADEYQIWISDSKENNFRYKLDPTYKANRPEEKPIHFEEIKEYLVTKWNARFAFGMEADDALGIAQGKCWKAIEGAAGEDGDNFSILCSIDKDLLQIPGNHYNFVKQEFKFVTPEEGLKAFYTQIVVGDVSDNISGCPGIGPVKAARLLADARTEQDLFSRIYGAYRQRMEDWSEERINNHILLVGRLLKIRQVEDEPLWDFPKA